MNYAKDEVTIAQSVDGAISIGEETYPNALAAIEIFNNEMYGGHNDWFIPDLFDAKRCIKNVGEDNLPLSIWTSTVSTEFVGENKIIFYDGTLLIVGSEPTGTLMNFLVVRKQTITA